jgi:hypothetical protein
MLDVGSERQKKYAAIVLYNLSIYEPYQNAINDRTPLLIDLVRCGKPDTKEYVMRVLCELADNDDYHDDINKGIPNLIALLKSERESTLHKVLAAMVLLKLVHCGRDLQGNVDWGRLREVNQTAIRENDGIQPLIKLVEDSPDESLRDMAARALVALAYDNATNQGAIGEHGGIQALIKLVSNGTDEGRKVAAFALYQLADLDRNVQLFKAHNGVQSLIRLANTATPQRVVTRMAAAALGKLARYEDTKYLIISGNGIQALRNLAKEAAKRNYNITLGIATNALRHLGAEEQLLDAPEE